MPNKAATCQEIKEKVCEDRISALPDALLVQILLLLPIKEAVATSILSKPWRCIWTLMPKLVCKDTKHTNSKSGSLIRLLSSCPVLKTLIVVREKNDNVIKFTVKVPSLNSLVYVNDNDDDGVCGCGYGRGSLIIDSPQLKYLCVNDFSEDGCSIESMSPNLTMARVDVGSPPNENFLTYLSSVKFLHMTWIDETEVFCSCVNYSQLIECILRPCRAEYWVESVKLLLDNSPNLKVLMIETKDIGESADVPRWSDVPACLSSQLEILEWKKYGGTRDEKQLLEYILASSKCLKRAGISMRYSKDCNDKMKKKLRKELKAMPRASVSSELLFPAKIKWRSSVAQHCLFDL
ncbi:BnaA09g31230D [Brassica napus]|uniref:BnaA09g31230D protein n=1 Tax=Brassica napus TaxID=3708 RepID=A0A078I3I1_BRANA|nr:BnaA09g31230D [Brassica napus]